MLSDRQGLALLRRLESRLEDPGRPTPADLTDIRLRLKTVLATVPFDTGALLTQMECDRDLRSFSPAIRLAALRDYVRAAIGLLERSLAAVARLRELPIA